MNPEENKRMLALSYIVADLKAENMELAQRVQQLADDYNDVVRQLNGNEKRKDKNSKPTLGEVLDVRSRCYKLEVENRELKRFAKEIHTFVKYKNLYKLTIAFENIKTSSFMTHKFEIYLHQKPKNVFETLFILFQDIDVENRLPRLEIFVTYNTNKGAECRPPIDVYFIKVKGKHL